MPDKPSARSMLPQTYLCLWVSCRGGCLRGGAADLQAIVDAGQGDKPIKDMKFRCSRCGSRRTDFVVTSRDAARVQPWRPRSQPRSRICDVPFRKRLCN